MQSPIFADIPLVRSATRRRDTVTGKKTLTSESGFTLIELLVVMIIIGILLAVAIPLFMSGKSKGMATAAKENSMLAWKAMISCSQDQNGEFEGTVDCTSATAVLNEEDGLNGVIDAASCGAILPGAGKTCTGKFPMVGTAAAHFTLSATRTNPPAYFAVGLQLAANPFVDQMSGGIMNAVFKKCFFLYDVIGSGVQPTAKQRQHLCPKSSPSAPGEW